VFCDEGKKQNCVFDNFHFGMAYKIIVLLQHCNVLIEQFISCCSLKTNCVIFGVPPIFMFAKAEFSS